MDFYADFTSDAIVAFPANPELQIISSPVTNG
jgi:hypothetical protein